MALIACPDCGRDVSSSAVSCPNCGRPIAPQLTPSGEPDIATLPYFPVATHKFVVLSIVTFGIYDRYWSYQQWKRLRAKTGESLSPFWRAVFAPLWSFSLFKRIREASDQARLPTGWSSGALAFAYLALSMLWRLPDPYWWISLFAFTAAIPVQRAALELASVQSGIAAARLNSRYSAGNWVAIVLLGLFLILAIIGSFIPDEQISAPTRLTNV